VSVEQDNEDGLRTAGQPRENVRNNLLLKRSRLPLRLRTLR